MMRRLAWLFLFALAMALPVGCQSWESTPALLNVADLAPREVDVGDRVEVLGTGFPEGRSGKLTLRGDLHRPGLEPIKGVAIVLPVTATSQTRVGFVLTDEIQARLCGRDDEGHHTTFRGDVEVAFAPRASGAPPITGTVRAVTLDVAGPTVSPAVATARETEARRQIEQLGLVLATEQARSGLEVKTVRPYSRAARAGVQPGDVIFELDGVRVGTLTDLTVAGTMRFAELGVRRGQLKESVRLVIDVQGLRQVAPRDLAWGAALVGFVVLLLLGAALPLARVVAWLELRLVERLRQRRSEGAAPALFRRLRHGIAEESGDGTALSRLVPYLAFVAASAASTLLVYGRALVAPDLDLPLIVLGILTLLSAGALVAGGWRGGRRWVLRAGLGSALSNVLVRAPAVLGLVAVVVAVGSLRATEIVTRQGAAPWEWNAFRNPALGACLALLLITALPSAAVRRSPLPHADLEGDRRQAGLMWALEWVYLLVIGQLAAVAFLGGWQLGAASHEAWGPAAGAVLLQLKAWSVVVVALALRWVLPRLSLADVVGVWWRFVLPTAVCALGASVAWVRGRRFDLLETAEPLIGIVLFAACVVLAALTLWRVWKLSRLPRAAHVNPWL